MFQYLLLQSVQNTASVFAEFKSPTEEPAVADCKEAIEAYNAQAKQVWSEEGRNFMRRRARCSAIYEERLLALRPAQVGFPPGSIPKEVLQELDRIFKAHYKTLTERLLLGRLDDIPRVVNTAYVEQVARALGHIDSRYESRVLLSLYPLYGRGAPLPVMTEASVEAMWEVCESHYYTVQLNAVSSTHAVVERS
jgi:hypothetical protein